MTKESLESLRQKGFVESGDGQWHKSGSRTANTLAEASSERIDEHPTNHSLLARALAGTHNRKSESATGASGCKNERQLQEMIANYLRLHDIWFCRSRMDRRTTTAVGTADFLLAYHGMPVALEAKMPGAKQTPEQVTTMEAMRHNGWCYYVVHSLVEAIAALANADFNREYEQ